MLGAGKEAQREDEDGEDNDDEEYDEDSTGEDGKDRDGEEYDDSTDEKERKVMVKTVSTKIMMTAKESSCTNSSM